MLLSMAGDTGACLLVLTSSRLPLGLYDGWSLVYVYTVGVAGLLEPNTEVDVGFYEPCDVDAGILGEAESVQRRSWGFYVPPPPGDTVFIARLRGVPVGAAYYNPVSNNIDYGIHVAREHWRRRIGTRLLHEILGYAAGKGAEWVTVIRIIRGKKPASSDRRAMGFYEANNPASKLNVYRLTRGPMSPCRNSGGHRPHNPYRRVKT